MVEKEEKIVEEIPEGIVRDRGFDYENWNPKTELGKKVKSGEIKDIDEIFEKGYKILEPEIIDALFPNLESMLINAGQSKGKFGGGKKSIWIQTQKKTKEGTNVKFATVAVVGNRNGYVGIGHGKSKETMPAREKAVKQAKLSIIRIRRGCGSWETGGENLYSIPFKVSGKSGSAKIELIPAPKGTGLCVENECKKVLELAGIKDIYSKSKNSKTKLNLIKACFDALRKLSKTKVDEDFKRQHHMVEGRIK